MLFKRGYIGGIKGAILLLFIDIHILKLIWKNVLSIHKLISEQCNNYVISITSFKITLISKTK